MNAQIETITPTFPRDTLFDVALRQLPKDLEDNRELITSLPRLVTANPTIGFRGVPDSPLHD